MYIKNEILKKNKSKVISTKVSDKTFTLQFLPECMYDLENIKTIEYKEFKLKTDYIIDITHNLLLKYYFKKDNRFPLNSIVLKDKYGFMYNQYINYMVDNNIIVMIKNYQTGLTSRVYALNDDIFRNKIKRYRNSDKVLIKKYKLKFVDMFDDSVKDLIDGEVKEKLVSDLFNVKIEYDRAIFYLNSVKYNDYDVYNRNIYSVECINNKHIFYHFDSYGRMHTNYTILKSFIRKNCLLIDGEETCELDINNSQPLFLTKLIADSKTKWVNPDEFELFKQLTISGKYYQYMMDMLGETNKKKIKEMTYKVLFGRNIGHSKIDKSFKSIFPTIHNFIKLYKKEHDDYKILAYDLQKAESNLIFNKIIKRIINTHPHIKMITIHDSIVIPKKDREIASIIFQDELAKEFDLI